MMEICLATNNAHKLQEIMAILPSDFRVKSLADIGFTGDIPETQETLEGNSEQKARYIWERYHMASLADDTGLEVDALGGAPGVYSARFAGPERNDRANVQLLLEKMQGISNRTARFRTVMTFLNTEGNPVFFEGILEGSIAENPRGENGFGYDPVFLPEGSELTLAEISSEEKNRISHRGRSLQKFAEYFKS